LLPGAKIVFIPLPSNRQVTKNAESNKNYGKIGKVKAKEKAA
jgi:hypothetical protein